MAASEVTVTKMVTEALNASQAGVFSASIDPNNYDRVAEAITEAVRQAALMIARAVIVNPQHVHRNLFVSATPTAITNDSELPDMAGDLGVIEIKHFATDTFHPGQVRDIQQIDSFRNDIERIYDDVAHNERYSILSGYYGTQNGRVRFTGHEAQCYRPLVDRTTVTTLIPDEYEPVWIALSIGGFTMKEGDNAMPIQQTYMQYGLNELASVSNMSVIQPMPVMEQQRKTRGNP
jgi:hypothetical protein